MSDLLRVRWTVVPRTVPQPWLACSRCGGPKPFRCSQKFRVNASGKRLDAWLIYKCTDCDGTWNRPIVERQNRRDLAPLFLHALETNDPAWVRRFACDLASLTTRGKRAEEFVDVDVRKRVLSSDFERLRAVEIVLDVPVLTALRADRLLAHELCLPRARIEKLEAKGRLILPAFGKRALRRPVRDGMNITLDLLGEADGRTIAMAAAGLASEAGLTFFAAISGR